MRLSLLAWATAILGRHTLAIPLGQALTNHGSLSMLHDLLRHLDLLERFETAKRSTFLAMTDDALLGLADWGLNLSSIDPTLARGILEYHFLEGVYTSSDPSLRTDVQLVHSVMRPPILTNVTDGPVVKLSVVGGSLHVESGIQKVMLINESDMGHDNGVLHTINSNLVLPHNISETADLGSLSLHEFGNIMERSRTREVLEAMKDVTVFLPNDRAVRRWRSLLDSLSVEQLARFVANHAVPNQVLYHSAFSTDGLRDYRTLSGFTVTIRHDARGDVFVNEARILRQDVLVYGGVAHILDDVLISSGHRRLNCHATATFTWSYMACRWLGASPWQLVAHEVVVAAIIVSLAALAILGAVKL
ncbi:Fasciclin-like arabinogalactan protein [Colletotrichum tanaceti]|uniref:Fasciclin-like arabinogalactan protein n=1 Tax=Colletotrichum tanaceti TaxID=1306861 RepID=A0A4V6DHW9_9PEZI|nr:Fasciclin-like arabinogalactan protein [Colletotrichum tanaceti]TKW58216.1 Fasciclin-like arabinogalactan protein [Colletotrichum tanaceti]